MKILLYYLYLSVLQFFYRDFFVVLMYSSYVRIYLGCRMSPMWRRLTIFRFACLIGSLGVAT